MFLTKNPKAYWQYTDEWPCNTMQGVTMTCEQPIEKQQQTLNDMNELPHPFISIEPLLGELKTPLNVDLVIVGAMTGPGATVPRKEWIRSIIHKRSIMTPIYWKNNIKKYLQGVV